MIDIATIYTANGAREIARIVVITATAASHHRAPARNAHMVIRAGIRGSVPVVFEPAMHHGPHAISEICAILAIQQKIAAHESDVGRRCLAISGHAPSLYTDAVVPSDAAADEIKR